MVLDRARLQRVAGEIVFHTRVTVSPLQIMKFLRLFIEYIYVRTLLDENLKDNLGWKDYG